ncbi:MAG: hypothetical protein ACI9FR_002006 [Cryomorphaceae bacterium]|jgi:hypothetical protein
MTSTKTTHCPNCGVEIDVNELLYHQLDEQARQKYQDQLASAQTKLKQQQAAVAEQSEQISQTVKTQVANSLVAEKAVMLSQLKAQVEQDQSERIKAMQNELEEKSKKVIELNKMQGEVERLKREKNSLRSEIELEVEKKFNTQLAEQSEKIQKQLSDQVRFKVAEKEQVINQLKDQLSEAQRKAEQGSMQIQGEVQELAIEDWLRAQFPLDEIQEIKKGATGADTLQVINTINRTECGSIYYESKRTKAFQPAWVAKFKSDIQQKGASIGVLVTQVMPEGMGNLGQIDGVWVCTFDEFKNLSQVLRESIIQIDQALVTQDNKGDKMGMLYDFLTGSEFRMQIEAIVEGFTQLKIDLESEKRAMQGIWKKREKQIERVMLNTNYMYNSVKGIAGSAVQNVALLELDDQEDDN